MGIEDVLQICKYPDRTKKRITKLAAHISFEQPQKIVAENPWGKRMRDGDDEDASLVSRRKPPSGPPSFGMTKRHRDTGGSNVATIKKPKFSVGIAPVLGMFRSMFMKLF